MVLSYPNSEEHDMNTGIARIFALLLGLALFLSASGGVTLAQGNDPLGAADTPVKNPDSVDTITLPDSGTTTTAGTAWSITNNGIGRVGFFYQHNPVATLPAIEARTTSTGTGAAGVLGTSVATNAN